MLQYSTVPNNSIKQTEKEQIKYAVLSRDLLSAQALRAHFYMCGIYLEKKKVLDTINSRYINHMFS